MKSNHFKTIFFMCVLSFLFTISTVQANTISIKHTDEGKIIQYGKPFSVEITDVNQLDYKYSVKIEYELPKPQTLAGPQLPSGLNIMKPKGVSESVDDKIRKTAGFTNFIENLNKLLIDRLTRFGKAEIDDWFDKLEQLGIEFSKEDESLLCEEGEGRDLCLSQMTASAKKLANEIKSSIVGASNKDEAGHLMIEKKDIANSMLKTKPGGALIITIEAKAKKWKIGKNTDGSISFESNGTLVEKIDELQLTQDQEKIVKDHIAVKIIRIEFEGPKGITFSFGPYISLLTKRNTYESIMNPNFEEGSTDVEKKDKYYIGLTEESAHIYGVAAFWNAPVWEDTAGVCWGIAYNLQEKIDKGISGLMGFYCQMKDSAALINFGVSVGQFQELADGYEIKTPIGENEKIPLKTKLKFGVFISISFKM